MLETLLKILVVLVALGGALIAFMWWTTTMPGKSAKGANFELDEHEHQLRDRLRAHVEVLAGEIGPRHERIPEEYDKAASYLEGELEGMGYDVERQPVESRRATSYNLIARLEGSDRADELVIVGGHYDTAGEQPGADDNASGAAGVIELARSLRKTEPSRTIVFVLFANEEPPNYRQGGMGSLVMAKSLRDEGARVKVMFSLEMLGYYDDSPGSQHYPAPLSYFYPDRGNFIGFVGKLGQRGAVTRSIERFRAECDFPSYGFAGPASIPGVGFSDHWAFWKHDFTAVMVTDTAFFRNPHYHKRSDTPETLDYNRFARVVGGLHEVIWDWANDE